MSTIGFFGLVVFHSTEFLLSLNLAIISIGLSLSSVGAQNVIILSIPRQNSGASLGMTTFLRIVGSSVAPALSGMFMQGYQYAVNIGGNLQFFPSSESYNLIFLTSAILSIISISLAVVLFRTRPPKCQNHLPEEKATWVFRYCCYSVFFKSIFKSNLLHYRISKMTWQARNVYSNNHITIITSLIPLRLYLN